MITQGLSKEKAFTAGFTLPLTVGFKMPHENWMLNNVLNDMSRGGIDAATVETKEGTEVWRKPRSNRRGR